MNRGARIIKGDELPIPDGKGKRRILLINPPVYDTQYWSRWSQPAGLLRLATLLHERNYRLDLIDCMEADALGHVQKRVRSVDGSIYVHRDDVRRTRWHFGIPWESFKSRLTKLEAPDEIWVTSIMTYWWESTRDVVTEARKVFPGAKVVVGGVYPTLAPEHAAERLGADVIVTGEVPEANNKWTNFDLYERKPTYCILATSRGCPWDCHYCAARALNGGSSKVRSREPGDVLEEIEFKIKKYGIRRYGFYEDNSLVLKGHLQAILQMILDRGLKLDLYAPEGFETRFLTEEVLRVMKQSGFKRVHLPFEALKMDTNLGWNRRHASTSSFERAVEAAKAAGFKTHTQDLNAFVLFGLPDESLEDIMDGVLYVHHHVGSVIPMLFTPVPSTHIYDQQRNYLTEQMSWDLQDLNGKLLPFLEYNRRHQPTLRASDYLELEKLMSILNNGKFMSRTLDLCGDSPIATALRTTIKRSTEEKRYAQEERPGTRPVDV